MKGGKNKMVLDMLDDMEVSPGVIILALLGGGISLFVMKNVSVGPVFKIFGVILSTVASFFLANYMANKG